MKARLLFAQLAELPKRVLKFDKGIEVILNGEENDYPERVERLIDNSITAKQCRKLFRQFLTGKGFGEELNKVYVHPKKQTTLLEFLNNFNREFSTHGGVFVHVMYNIDGNPVWYDVIPYTDARKGKKDSKDYNGKFAIYKDWSDVKKGDIKWLDNFNPEPKIVQDQILKDKGINKYKGQLFYFNPSNTDYPLAHIHPVMNDADSEFRSGVFKNKSLRKGFFGKNILVTPPRIDPNLTRVPVAMLSDEERAELQHQETAAGSVSETLKGFVGVENHEGFMSLEMEFEGDSIDKAIKHIKIESDIDDKLFAYTESSSSNNIRKSYNNVPLILVDSSDAKSLFGNSGEAVVQAKLFYQEQTEEERMMIEQCLKKLFKNYDKVNTEALKIQPLIEKPAQDGINNA
tara:strand:+ start:439 stop:1644 length:1206 start_codon:yes stop_codon:yes gene_type:complete